MVLSYDEIEVKINEALDIINKIPSDADDTTFVMMRKELCETLDKAIQTGETEYYLMLQKLMEDASNLKI